MEIALQIIVLVAGFIFLIKGADVLVDGASSAAQNFKVSKMLIGLTIVAFGTSAPELAVSISALASGSTDIVLGNVIGSNIINILLLIGIAALIKPIRVKANTVRKELPLCLLISSLLAVLFLDVKLGNGTENLISRADAIVVLLFFGIFLYYLIAMAKHNRKQNKDKDEKPPHKLWVSILFVILGLAGVILGSQMVVNSATFLAQAIGVSERVISLTIIAFGTSLPELVTTITAARKGEQDLLIGNIVGSNIFNICVVLGIPVALFGSVTTSSFHVADLIMLVFSALILFILARNGHKITRLDGGLMLLIFTVYYGLVVSGVFA